MRSVAVVVCVLGAAPLALGQCDWQILAQPGAEMFEGLHEPEVRAMIEADLPSGHLVYAGGLFSRIGGVDAQAIAAWDGFAWREVGGGFEVSGPARFENPPVVNDMILFDAGDGPDLYVVGGFNTADALGAAIPVDQIAMWNGVTWQPVGGGLGPVGFGGIGAQPSVLEVYDGELYAGGFLRRDFGSPGDGLARWDGSTWRDTGGAFLASMGYVGHTYAMEVFDGKLYVGGFFATAPGDVAASNIACWDGTSWTDVGGGVDGEVWSLAVHDGELYVGGKFENTGAGPAANIARWDGAAWSALGDGVTLVDNGAVLSLHSHDGSLFVGGAFAQAGGIDSPNLARWNGTWSGVEGPITGSPSLPWILPAVHTLSSGTLGGAGLLVGGFFDEVAAGVRAGSLAKLACDTCYADFDGDGSLTIFDFLGFQNAFDAGDTRADCDDDGSLTIFDFLCFQNLFDAGCK